MTPRNNFPVKKNSNPSVPLIPKIKPHKRKRRINDILFIFLCRMIRLYLSS